MPRIVVGEGWRLKNEAGNVNWAGNLRKNGPHRLAQGGTRHGFKLRSRSQVMAATNGNSLALRKFFKKICKVHK